MVIPPLKKRHGLPSRGLPYGCEISYAQRQIPCAPRLSHDTRPSCAGPARMMPLRSRQGKGAVLLVPYGRTATSPLSALVRFTTDVVRTPPAALFSHSLLAAKEATRGKNGHAERLIGVRLSYFQSIKLAAVRFSFSVAAVISASRIA